MERWCTALSRLKNPAGLLALLLAGLLLFTTPAAKAGDAAALPEGYLPVAQSAGWTLYLKEDNLGLIMQNRATGRFMASTVLNPGDYRDNELWKGFYQSGIVLEYIEGTVNKYPWANLVQTEHTKSFTYQDRGFDCEVYYPDLGIAYTAQVRLEDNCLSVMIPQALIREELPGQYCVGSFYVYPFMGYTHMGESGGYILIPDGQGALIDLKDNEGRFTSPFKTTVYGNNIGLTELAPGAVLNNYSTNNPPERAAMPVFGIRHNDTDLAFLSVIEKGDTSATIQAYLNGVGNMAFDWACAQYTYRVVYAQSTGPSSGTVNMRTPRSKSFDIAQRFYFLSGEGADYAGMAREYRKHLKDQGAFSNVRDSNSFDIQVDFLGAERENGLLGTQPVVMTTAGQAAEILRALHKGGVSNIFSVFRGWQSMGLTGGKPTAGYNPAGELGGRGGFTELFKAAQSLGASMVLEADVASMVPDTAGTLVFSALKKVDSNTYTRRLFGQVYNQTQYLTPGRSLELARAVSKEFQQYGVPGVSLTGITQLVTDYTHRQVYYDSPDCAALYAKAAETFGQRMPAALSSANAYLWRYASALTGMPIGGSDYVFASGDAPFMAIALSGEMPVYAEYTNFQANTRQFFLKLVEQGARPSFLLTWEDPILLQETNANSIYSSKFDLYEDLIVKWYRELSLLHMKIAGSGIKTHVREGDLVRVGYENGLTILINYSDGEANAWGTILPGFSYKVTEAPEHE